jgi:hypothetical protein
MTRTKAAPSLSPAAWSLPEGEIAFTAAQNGPAYVPQPRDYGLARASKPAEKDPASARASGVARKE